MSRQVRVCVVGAGAGGLCAARHLCQLPQFFIVDVIESTPHVGGTWMNPDTSYGHQYVKLVIVLHKKVWSNLGLVNLSTLQKYFSHKTYLYLLIIVCNFIHTGLIYQRRSFLFLIFVLIHIFHPLYPILMWGIICYSMLNISN